MADERTLDPDDWDALAALFHREVDLSLMAMRTVREAPVWQPTPPEVKALLHEPLPLRGTPLEQLAAVFEQSMRPYATGNTHPRFLGWVHGSGNTAGVLGEMLAAFINCNAGGRDHIATYVERQVISWCRELFGFPADASGILTSGTSMGTVIALAAARGAQAPFDVRQLGLAAGLQQMVGYASTEAHSSIAKAFSLLGLGAACLRQVPVDGDFRLSTAVLANMIAADRAAGLAPFCVIASAGTVNTGAIDPLDDIVRICRSEGLWLHVDAAFGGVAMAVPDLRPRLLPIAHADSIAFDFHKWMHVPYDAGAVLVRDPAAQAAAFAARPHYLAGQAEGLAGGEPWYCDFGPELSRGFRALKVWFTIKAHGMDALSYLMARNCAQARLLAGLIDGQQALERLAPVGLNIVCFRHRRPGADAVALDRLNAAIVTALQVSGVAVPSTTRIRQALAIRVAITNHRTQDQDMHLLVAEVLRLGATLPS
jgi:glutamate/tyrosine decarboxylase-like PLP-dependent enzyme